MSAKQCAACGQFFKPLPQTPNQTYCSKPDCQRERRRLNKQAQRQANQEAVAKQNRAWAALNPGYWKQYREDHPDYVERNRIQQTQRNRQRKRIAKTSTNGELPPGRYALTRLDAKGIAKGASWIVEITVLSGPQRNG